MQCETCHTNPATVHLTQVTEEGIRKIHLCEACAEQAGLDLHDAAALADALLVGLGKKTASPDMSVSCSNCHLSLSDFKRTGRLGCPHCYTAFHEPLQSLIRSTHRAERHRGKRPPHRPSPSGDDGKRTRLRSALNDAIRREAFEEAALIRDQIKALASPARPEGETPS